VVWGGRIRQTTAYSREAKADPQALATLCGRAPPWHPVGEGLQQHASSKGGGNLLPSNPSRAGLEDIDAPARGS
jgi:hypothetical protein